MNTNKKHIVAIEDDPTYIRLLETCLKTKGYELTVIPDGLQALTAIRKIMPDLIITDLMLPGMDGHKVCRMIKFDKKTSHIPVIMLTARDLDKEAELAKQCRADLFISKTRPIQDLLKILPKMLTKSEEQREAAK